MSGAALLSKGSENVTMPLLFTFNRNELTWPVSWDATPRHAAPHTAHCALRQEAGRHLHTNNATTQRAERCHDPAFYYYDVYHNDDMHNSRQKKFKVENLTKSDDCPVLLIAE